jgi:hypothetical protein
MTTTAKNRRWTLGSRPEGPVETSNFKRDEVDVPDLRDGDVLIRIRFVAFEPAMSGWMRELPSYVPPVALGAVMRASASGIVVASRHDGFSAGDRVTGLLGWQDYAVVAPRTVSLRKIPGGVSLSAALSVFGITGLTAYFGMLDIGQPRAGHTVLVSGAAGATGSVAGQIAKRLGCRVVGIAGGEAKCRWLTEEAHFDAAIDYKREDLRRRVGELCESGVNVFFDNVGGDPLEAALAHLAERGRIVLCGAISRYNAATVPSGPANYPMLIIRRGTMQGFIVLDHLARAREALAELKRWVDTGEIVYREDVAHGFDEIPQTFLRLFTGANQGKQLLELDEPA